MSEAPTTRQLIALAQRYVREGGIATITLENGLTLPPSPLVIMSLVPEMLWFLLAFEDHAHGVYIKSILPGDDGEVLVNSSQDETVVEIFTTWTEAQRELLEHWLTSTRTEPIELPVGPTPPDIVRYAGQPRR